MHSRGHGPPAARPLRRGPPPGPSARPLTERAACDAWRAASAQHDQAYAATERLWQELRGLASDPNIAALPAAALRYAVPTALEEPAPLPRRHAILNTACAPRTAREITLRQGEALFDVRHDARCPFTVPPGLGTVIDLGTRFVVRSHADRTSVA